MDELLEAIRAEARQGEMPIDTAVYEAAGVDPIEPVLLGSGTLAGRVGIFGRDPGRTEVELREPFIGKGGQLIRAGLHRALHGGEDPPDLAASIEAGRGVLWANTVPYKPLGNKAWSVKIKRRFLPMVRRYLGRTLAGGPADHLRQRRVRVVRAGGAGSQAGASGILAPPRPL